MDDDLPDERRGGEPLGDPLPSDRASVDARATITPTDVAEAKRWAARQPDKRWARMLLGSGFEERQRRYREGSRTLTPEEVRARLDRAIVGGVREGRKLGEGLRDRRINLADFQTRMGRVVKSTQLNAVSGAAGGWAKMTAADYARASNAIRRQNRYLDNFATEVASGKQKRDGTLVRRAGYYAEAARGTYEGEVRRQHRSDGYAEERRVRSASDSCNGCVAAAALGWQPIGTLPEIGAADCKVSCKCTFEYRGKGEGRPAFVGRDGGPGPDGPGFTPAGDLDGAARFAEALEVEADYSAGGANAMRMANATNEALAEASARGLPLPARVEVDRGPFVRFGQGDEPAAFLFARDALILNPDSPFWLDPAGESATLRRKGFWSTDSPLHAVRHELGHVAHYRNDLALYADAQGLPLEPAVRAAAIDRLSVYAATDRREFVAEVFARLLHDPGFDDPIILDAYRRYGGMVWSER